MSFAVVTAVGVADGDAPALVCVQLEEPFVAGVTSNAMVKAVRERLATQNIDVLPCATAGEKVNVHLVMRRATASSIEITASGDHAQRLDIDPKDPADVVRQASLVASELVDPALIAWRDTRDSAFYTEPEKVAPAPVVEEGAEVIVDAPTRLVIGLGGAAGAKLSTDNVAYRAEVAAQLRMGKWRAELDLGADRSTSSTQAEVDSRLTNLTLGITVGRELFKRLFLGIGAQGQRTFATLSSARPVRSVAAWDYGARVVGKVAVWRSDALEVGLGGRLSWWHAPIRLTIEGSELRRGPRVDTTVFAFVTVLLGN